MASLLPSLSSDEENDIVEDNDEEEVDDLNKEFSFGGVLGEDGGFSSRLTSSTPQQQGWSYQTALDNLNNGTTSKAPPRMDVASLIAAKRKSLKRPDKEEEEEKKVVDDDDDDKNSDEGNSSDETEKEESENDGSGSDDDDDDDNDKDGSSGSDEEDSDDDDDEVDDKDREMEEDIIKIRMGEKEEEEEKQQEESESDDDESDEEEAEKAANFFETKKNDGDDVEVFAQLTLSRPLLRGVAAMGYVKPTPIQSSVIPVALAGRDICASAVTGSGKTAAFLLPILEKLLHRAPGRISALILTPTRELAAQCLGMMSTLAQFTKISSVLVVGGSKNVNSQTAELRGRPQLVVATPGRLLDHVRNSAGVSLADVEFLVLDEADRLLDLGFQEEVTELIKACPVERQTMLFSATMNTKVDDLINLSLKRPVRVKISNKDSNSASSSKHLEVAPRLEQEFVRVRSGNEGVNREGMLLALLTRNFSTQTIVFFDTKAKAHRMMILCGLCGIKCAELHGNLTQPQRLESLEQFRKGEVDVLLATDLAARGLDISRVETVINFEMPNQVESYIHRIGRTARAGRGGRSCTLIGEGRRYLMKQIMKDAADKNKNEKKVQAAVIRSRSIPAAVIAHFAQKIESLEAHVDEVREAEAVARMDRLAEMEAVKAQNIIEHSDEINARPQRQWFASEEQKKMTKEASLEKAQKIKDMIGTGVHRMTRKKRRAREAKQMCEEDMMGDDGDDEESTPVRPPSMKRIARDHKRELEQKMKERTSKSTHEMDMERAANKKRKVTSSSSSDALGDSGLFSEEKIAHAPKNNGEEGERAQSNYGFRGFDPAKDGKKKPKSKSVNKFKSKSKYKRK